MLAVKGCGDFALIGLHGFALDVVVVLGAFVVTVIVEVHMLRVDAPGISDRSRSTTDRVSLCRFSYIAGLPDLRSK